MRIKKNGKVINLTESDIKKLSKSILKEQTQEDIDFQDNVIHSNRRFISLQEQVDNNTKLIKNLYGWMYTDANRK